MIYRFRILTPSSIVLDSCGLTPFAAPRTAMDFDLKVDGESVLSTTDLGAVAFPITYTSPTTGMTSTLSLEDTDFFTLKIDYPIKSRPFDSINVYIKIEQVALKKYENTITVYGYDIGNNPNILNIPGNAIDYNVDMDIILERDVTGIETVYSKFVAYRKPFSDKIYIHDLTSDEGTKYYEDSDGNIILNGRNGFYQNNDTISIRQVKTGIDGISVCASEYQQITKKIWKPDFVASVSCEICDDDCISIDSQNTVETEIDYASLSTVFTDDFLSYPYRDQRIHYKLYDSSGTLISEKIFNFNIGFPSFVYDKTLYAWTNWNLPEQGDFVIKVCLSEFGIDTSVTLDSANGTLVEGSWYRIKTVDIGTDFMISGASATLVGIEFAANNVVPIWNEGSLNLLSEIAICCKNYPITGCHWFNVEQIACNSYTIQNKTFNDFILNVSELTAKDTFTLLAAYTNITITSLTNYVVTHAKDGVYKYEVIRDGVTNTYIVFVFCNIESCSLDFINKLLCGNVSCETCGADCSDYCKTYYNFNSFILNGITFFAMINSEYGFNYIYSSLNADKLNEIYEIKQVLDRLAEYCDTTTCCEKCSAL